MEIVKNGMTSPIDIMVAKYEIEHSSSKTQAMIL